MTLTQAEGRKIARPLKTLVPMIQSELQQGNNAGREHYRRAGEMLIEAKDLVGYGGWGQWLTKNFDLSRKTASVYMRWAREHDDLGRGAPQPRYQSLREMRGDAERAREERQSKQHQAFRRVMHDIARDDFARERQTHGNEIIEHRKIADKVIDIGFKALAKEYHPDVGGSRIQMARLNTVIEQLKQFVKTRRFV